MSVRSSIGVEVGLGRIEATAIADAPLALGDLVELEGAFTQIGAPAGTRIRVTTQVDGSLLIRASWPSS